MATTEKYDRQLRLWGAHGQKRLAEAHICVIGSDSAAVETLKNLVLPGIGEFTVVDDAVVTGNDVSKNFFVDTTSVGQSRGETAVQQLLQLNPDVKGKHRQMSPFQFATDSTMILDEFDLIVVSGAVARITEMLLFKEGFLHRALKSNIPLIFIRSLGFLGVVRNYFHQHCVVESKPDPAPLEDLHLYKPFKKLKAFVNELKQSTGFDARTRKLLPYSVVLVEVMQSFQQEQLQQRPSLTGDDVMEVDSVKKKVKVDHTIGSNGHNTLAERTFKAKQDLNATREHHLETLFGNYSHLFLESEKYATFLDYANYEVESGACDQPSLATVSNRHWAALLPSDSTAKKAFKAAVKGFFKVTENGVVINITDSENYSECLEKAYTAYAPRNVNEDLRALLSNGIVAHILEHIKQPADTESVDNGKQVGFWVMVTALKLFLESNYGNQLLPLSGSLPDMSSSTAVYTSLQAVYHQKHEIDYLVLSTFIDFILRRLKLESGAIPSKERLLFAKHVGDLKMFQGIEEAGVKTQQDIFQKSLFPKPALDELFSLSLMDLDSSSLKDAENSPRVQLGYYTPFLAMVFLRSLEKFISEKNCLPTTTSEKLLDDLVCHELQLLKDTKTENEMIVNYLNTLQGYSALRTALMKEFLRAIKDETHFIDLNPISSVVGSIAAQEAMKLLTKQFEPLNNTFVFIGMNSTAEQFRL